MHIILEAHSHSVTVKNINYQRS